MTQSSVEWSDDRKLWVGNDADRGAWRLQLVKKFPAFYGTRKFITVLTSARHPSLSCANSIQSPQPLRTSSRSILILSSHLRLGLPNGLFLSGFPTKTLCSTATKIRIAFAKRRVFFLLQPWTRKVLIILVALTRTLDCIHLAELCLPQYCHSASSSSSVFM